MPAAVLLPESPSTPGCAALTLRPRRHLVLLACGLFLCLWLVSWFGLLGELEVSIGALPVTVMLQGLSAPAQVAVTYVTTVGDSDGDQKQFGYVIPKEELMFPDAGRASWRIAGHWIQTIHVTAPVSVLQALRAIDIRIGDEVQHYDRPGEWKRVPERLTGLLPDRTEPAVTIELPASKVAGLPAINSVPLATFVQRLFTFPLVSFAALMIVAWALLQFIRSAAGTACWSGIAGSFAEPKPASWGWFLAGLAFAAAAIGSLYARFSYPFTQDDNFSQFLPMTLYNCHAILTGHWPAWNPHQFMGAPVATMGIYSVTYPPVYLAYGLARLCGNEFWTIEIYTLLHLAAAYTLLTLLLRRMGVRPELAALGGASFILSGWFLIAGRSQMTFAPLALWPVAMAWSIHALVTAGRASWKWTLWSGVSLGLFFHAGHSQMWVYGVMFYVAAVGVHWLSGRLVGRQVVGVVPALLIGIGIAAPLLILQAIEGTASARGGAYGDRIEFLHMLLPLGKLLPRPVGLGSAGYEYFCEMYYSGTLFQALSFLALGLAGARFMLHKTTWREVQQWLGENAWLVLLGLAIVFGLGSKGILWTVFAQLPIFDRFRWPIKFAYFCVLFSTLGGAVVAERWFTRWPRLQYPVIGVVAGLLLIHANFARTSWYDFADRPYPGIPAVLEPAANRRPSGRLLTRWGSMDRSPVSGFYNTLPLDFATQAGAYAVGGYDTFLEGSLAARRVRYKFWADPIAAARAYGVRWVVSDRVLDHPVASANPVFSSLDAASVGNVLAIHAVQDAGRLVGTQDGLTVSQLEDAAPMAFLASSPANALPIDMNSEGLTVDTSSARPGDVLICNVAMRPWMRAAFPLEEDEWGRIRVRMIRAADKVSVAYAPPWRVTLLIGGLLILAGVAMASWTHRLSTRQVTPAAV